MSNETTIPKVYAAIAAVTEMMAKEGISKDRKNLQQGYNFRGIDDVYNALSPALSKAHLCILPNVLERVCEERQTQKGGVLFYVTVRVCFSFVSADDGSKHEVFTYGEAMDSADKATNKAMSAAYKYAAMQAFCIPTEGDNDADAHTHEPLAKHQQTKPASVPNGYQEFEKTWLEDMRSASLNGAESLQAAFAAMPSGDHKKEFWRRHGDSLKAATQKADARTGFI